MLNKDDTFNKNIETTQTFEEEKRTDCQIRYETGSMNEWFFPRIAYGIILRKNSENEALRLRSGFLIGH